MDTESTLTGLSQTAAETPPAQTLLPLTPAPRDYFSVRFLLVYLALGAILVGSIVAFVVFALGPTIHSSPAWSNWRPSAGTNQKVAKQIADHIAPRYHLSGGGQLVAVVPSNPTVTAGTQNIALNAVAVREAQTGRTDVRQLAPGTAEMYTLCGLGTHCAIASGTPSLGRGRLVRREALETALYTFKYLPAIQSIIIFMPPTPTSQATSVLFFEREELADRLKRPLVETLPLAKPPSPDIENTIETPTIEGLTLPRFYLSNLTQLQSGGALLVLTPRI
jgi:hypothetical protein